MKRSYTKYDAVLEIYPNNNWVQNASGVLVNVDNIEIDETLVQAKIAELEAAEPMRLLKEERNQRIAATDWRFLSDQTPSSAWIDYRQALRDLPANSTPELDEDGNLINVNWPVEPTE